MVLPRVRLLVSSVSHLPLHTVFRASGVTQKHGFDLEIDIVNVPQGNKPVRKFSDRVPCLLSGEYEFLSGLHHETYVCRARGEKRLVYLAQTQNDWDDRLIARPEIRDPKQLEGKKVITSQAACTAGNLEHALRRAGVDTSQVEFIYSRNTEGKNCYRTVEQVANGDADAANIDIPFDLQGKKRGLHTLEVPALPVIHNTTICSSTEFIRRNEETAIAFLKALIETIRFFKTEKQQVCEILSRDLAPMIHLQGDDEVEYLQREWAKLLSVKPYPDPRAVWNVYNLEVAQDQEVNFIGPFEPWDLHYLRKIDDEGFIEGLYSKEYLKRASAPHP